MAENAPAPNAANSLRGSSNTPLRFESAEDGGGGLKEESALCFSGGGFRATLFHAGVLLRLNEVELLQEFTRISSVSGGSITAAMLGMQWTQLGFPARGTPGKCPAENLMKLVVEPLRKLCSTTVDVSSIFWGSLNPWSWISDQVASHYDEIFQGRTLQALPSDAEGPRFIINATNVKTGSLWRFSRPYMADYRVGMIENPKVTLARAVTASSAFPPVLSPMRLELNPADFKPGIPLGNIDSSLRREAILTDGGVYDNLGLEPVWKTHKHVYVSDAGRKMDDDLDPATDWAQHSRRLIDLLQHQTSNLRRRTVVGAFDDDNEPHQGAYWGIQTDINDYPIEKSKRLDCPHEVTLDIAAIPTRLTALSNHDQERIMNWGYAVCDAALRSRLEKFKAIAAPTKFPFEATGLG